MFLHIIPGSVSNFFQASKLLYTTADKTNYRRIYFLLLLIDLNMMKRMMP